MQKKINLLFITHDSLNGGSGRCAYELMCLLKNESNIYPIVLCHEANSLTEALKKQNIETYAFRWGYNVSWTSNRFLSLVKLFFYKFIFNWLTFVKVKRKINLEKIDIIHSNSSALDFGAFLHRHTQIPHVWHLREFYSFLATQNLFDQDFKSYVKNNSNALIAVSDSVGKDWFPRGVENLKVIYDGVEKKGFFKKISNNPSKIKIVFCGLINPFKGQVYILEALSKLPQNIFKKISVDIYGTGSNDYIEYLKDKSKDLRLFGCVNFLGFDSNLKQKLANYDIGLNLSKAEGFGRTTVEYMLAGLYVIGFDTGATPEVLNYGKCGKLLEYANTEQLATAIQYYVENQNECKNIASLGQSFALENFCIENNYKKIIQVYQEVVNATN